MQTTQGASSEIGPAIIVVALGAFLIIEGAQYPIGPLTRIGGGFFPVSLGVILCGLGGILLFQGGHSTEARAPLRPRSFLMVCLGILSFAVLIERSGLVPATFSLVILSSLAERPVRLWSTLVSAAVLSALGGVIFVKWLGLSLQLIRW